MISSYFKPRQRFSFFPNRYDIGTFFGYWNSHDDNHFLLKIYKIDPSHFRSYYLYHLSYSLENKLSSQEQFFRHVWQIVSERIIFYANQNPFSSHHAIHKQFLFKLRLFEHYLNGIDRWNARPLSIVIAEKEKLIEKQKQEIGRLKDKLSQLNEYEVLQKISIEDFALPTLVDLLKQMSLLKLPSGRSFLACDKKSPYSKMISKYFSLDGKDIPLETARNYFVEKKGDVPIKGTAVRKQDRLFEIISIIS